MCALPVEQNHCPKHAEETMPGTIAREQLHTVQLVQITAFDAEGRIAQDTMRAHATQLF